MILLLRWAVCALCSFQLVTSSAFGGQKFVAVTGSDSSDGTFSQPWRTIQYAVKTLVPSDTLFIRAGTCAERIVIEVSGISEDSSISVLPFENDEVIISGASGFLPDIITISGCAYVNIIGLKIQDYRVPDTADVNRGGAAIRVRGNSHNITLTQNIISNISGVLPQGIALNGDDAKTPVGNIVSSAILFIHS